ncbi:hypothetical protein TIFTF001_054950 [Ficus carica]|uniref:Uncharacterized protein n=1 Tax=Ficus carica TaxID=3494 RepID=A0AA88EFN5_FICCA|nr:hypothetical protein TIFTF001_054950 [Ficus carica]
MKPTGGVKIANWQQWIETEMASKLFSDRRATSCDNGLMGCRRLQGNDWGRIDPKEGKGVPLPKAAMPHEPRRPPSLQQWPDHSRRRTREIFRSNIVPRRATTIVGERDLLQHE